MLLSDNEIKQRRLIDVPTEHNFRATSYDITVGRIVTSTGDEVDKVVIPPSGVVHVISRERIILPRNITSLAMVKTDLCNKGILALNIGIVGPGYDGLLSSALLNFSKSDFYLEKDDVFLRLIFQECYVSPRENWPARVPEETYIRDHKKRAINFSDKFLNVESIATEASKKSFGEFKEQAFKTVPLMVFVLGVLTFLLTFGVNYANRYIWSTDDVRKENVKAELLRELGAARESELESKLKDLEQKIDRLNGEQLRQTAASSPKQP